MDDILIRFYDDIPTISFIHRRVFFLFHTNCADSCCSSAYCIIELYICCIAVALSSDRAESYTSVPQYYLPTLLHSKYNSAGFASAVFALSAATTLALLAPASHASYKPPHVRARREMLRSLLDVLYGTEYFSVRPIHYPVRQQPPTIRTQPRVYVDGSTADYGSRRT
jgi:hypothetical protein